MGTYSDYEWCQLEADPAHDKRSPAMPTQSFDGWLRDRLAENEREDVEQLVDQGWTWDDALAFVQENPREGGSDA